MSPCALRFTLAAALLAACAENNGATNGATDAAADVTDVSALDVPVTIDVPAAIDTPAAMDVPAVTDTPDVPSGCTTDESCAGAAGGPVCDPSTRRCVACTPTTDRCPTGSYCAGVGQCAPGCRGDGDCASPAGDGGVEARRCEVSTRRCVACVVDAHCPAGNLCVGNLCVAGCSPTQTCPAGQTCCGGGCVSTQESTAHCGGCGMACAVPNGAPACLNGTCAVGMCTAPFADCDRAATNGCEVDTQSDVANCGGCGTACAARANSAATCAAGRCVYACAPGFADCDGDAANGCEVDTRASTSHCGACGRRCDPANATASCAMGVCGVASCATNFADCDGNATNGCEVDTRSSAAHCGACGAACVDRPNSLQGCVASRCVLACLAGFADCDDNAANGCEVNTRTSATSCGACGNACPSGICAGSVCQPPRCDDGLRNGAESDVDCGGTCAPCARCRACVMDRDCADGACGAQRRCTVRRELSINWVTNCRGPGGAGVPVTAAGLPAGTYEVTPLRSGGSVWNPVTFPSTGWSWNITCDNLSAPTLSTGPTLYPTPDAAFAAVASRTERVSFAGGDLVCAFVDSPCSDNQGGVSFRVERVCE
jgi:hypothetical protein